MLKAPKRKKIALLLSIISVSILVIVFLLSGASLFYGNKVVAIVENQRVYESDIKDELLEIFPSGDPATFEVNRLPDNVLELIAKSVYIKKHLYSEAKKEMIHKDKDIKENIDRYSKKLIRETYISTLLDKTITKEAVRARYLELSDSVKDNEKLAIGHILLNNKKDAEEVLNEIQEGKSFSQMANKYSLDKETSDRGGNLGYFSLKDMKKEFAEVVADMREGDISQPVSTSEGWHIVKLLSVTIPNLQDYEKLEGKIVEDLRREEVERIYAHISRNAEVKLLIKSK